MTTLPMDEHQTIFSTGIMQTFRKVDYDLLGLGVFAKAVWY